MIMIEEVNAVGVKFKKSRIRAGREKMNIYPKTYVFKISPVQAKKAEIGQVLYVKNKHNKRVPVIVQSLLKLAPNGCRKHKPILHK